MHPLFPASPVRQRQRQTGGVLIQFALMLTLLIGILAVIDIGYLYYAKRDLQRLADIAALESTESLVWGDADSCSGPDGSEAAGQRSIDAQWPFALEVELQRTECGNWELDNWDPELTTRFIPSSAPVNATRVTLVGVAPRFVPFNWAGDDPERRVSATAIAAKTQDPIAAFSIGSGVARLNDGALNSLLTALLGTTVDLDLVDYKGLANANIDLLGLQDAVGLQLGTYDELASAEVSLADLLNLAISAIENQPNADTLNVAIDALNKILVLPAAINLGDTFINLLKTETQSGLLDIGLYADNPASALTADVNALNLLLVGLQVANAESAAALEMNIPLPPLAEVDLKVRIIEPPAIAIGPPGYEGGVPRTSAHNGQIRVLADIKVLTPASGNNDLLSINLLLASAKLSVPAGQFIRLPLYLEVGSADGILDSIACRYQGRSHEVGIDVQPGLAHVFLGNIPDAFNNTDTAWEHLTKERFTLLGLNLHVDLLLGIIPVADAPISLNAKLALDIARPTPEMVYFLYDNSENRTKQDLIATVGSQKALGQSIGGAIDDGLLDVELDTSGLTVLGIPTGVLSDLIDELLNSVITILNDVLSLLNELLMPALKLLDGAVLGPLLEQLGLQLGVADVELLSAHCDTAQLVE
ncbi:MAG: pilus assembly protein TadG-related protein [Pseudomonas sp.]